MNVVAAIAAVRKGFAKMRSQYDVMVHYHYNRTDGLQVRLYYIMPARHRRYFAMFHVRATTTVYDYLSQLLPELPYLHVRAIGNPADRF